MNKIKKALLLAMSLVMSACVFAGCFGATAESSENTPPASEAPASSEEPEASEEPEVSEEPESSEEESVAPKAKYNLMLTDGHPMFPSYSKTIEVEEGADLAAVLEAEALTAEGKTFLGWKALNYETGELEAAPATMPSEDLNLRAAWELDIYTVTLTMPDETTKVYKFAAEDVYAEDPADAVIGIQGLGWTLEMEIDDLDTDIYDYYIEKAPEVWEFKNYELTVGYEKLDDADVTSKLAYFDRLNKWMKIPNDNNVGDRVKENKDNYWDGCSGIVEVENQIDYVYGDDSTYAMKLSFDPNKLTTEQCTAADAAWPGWSTAEAGRDSWVAFAIPVESLNLNVTKVTFDMMVDNMNADVIVYGVKVAPEGAGYVYEAGKNIALKKENAESLGDGWYRYTLTAADVQDARNGSRAADYFVFSLDNCQEGYDKTKASIAYIDNLKFEEDASHVHAYTTASYDEKNHYNECICGAIDESTCVEHTMEAKKDTEKHWEECTGCEYVANEGAHGDYTYEQVDDGVHKQVCGGCGYDTQEAHSPVWIVEEKRDVKKCPCGLELETFITLNDKVTDVNLFNGADGVLVGLLDLIGEEIFMQQNIKSCVEIVLFGDRVFKFDPTSPEFAENFAADANDMPAMKGSCFIGGNGESEVLIKFITTDGAEHIVRTKVNVTPIYEER